MSKKIAFLIVLYNKKLEASETFRSLSRIEMEDAIIHVHNNGPTEIGESALCNSGEVKIVNDLNNSPLSIVYNDFLNLYKDRDFFVILDDDTRLGSDYMSPIYEHAFDVNLPKVISIHDSKIHYPKLNHKPISDLEIINISQDYLMSIGSGLVISKELLQKFKCLGLTPFDNNYALYGVDSSFFKRLSYLNNFSDVRVLSKNHIVHDLSSSASTKISRFRYKERIIDRSITLRRYPTYIDFKIFLKSFLYILITLDFELMYVSLFSFIKGKHPKVQ